MDDSDNNALSIFIEDTKEKALISRSAKTKPNKKTRLPSNKEVEEKSGVMKSSSTYDNVMLKKDFDKLSKKEKHKALIEYGKRYSRPKLAEIWGVKVQSIHDMVYRLNKEFKVSEPPKPTEAVAEEPKKYVKTEEIIPLSFSIVKELTGSVVQDFILKALDFFTEGNLIEIRLSIKRVGNPKFKVSITVDDTMAIIDFNDEVMATLTLLAPTDRYLVSLMLKEITKK